MSQNKDSKKIWKSIRDYQDHPDVLKSKLNEFNEGVTEDFDPNNSDKFSRRKFLAVLAASSAYAATACTSYRDKGEIVAYVDRPEEILPGKPTYYASTFYDEGESYGILVKTREGRPIKIEGNPDDKINQGKISSKIHASILNLYDPERIKGPLKNGLKSSWEKVSSEINAILSKASETDKEIAIISYPLTSPSTIKVLEDFRNKFNNVKIYCTKLFNQQNRQKAWGDCYGRIPYPSIKWDKAKVILALESDFLGREGNTVENRLLYSKGRNIVETGELNKLYSAEAGMSLTGMNADERFRVKPELQNKFLLSIINELLQDRSIDNNIVSSQLKSSIEKASIVNFAEENSIDLNKLKTLVNDLSDNKGASIVYAGDVLSSETHMLVNLINDLLNNTGLYDFDKAFVNYQDPTDSGDIKGLIDKLEKSEIGALIHFETNPVYELSEGRRYSEAINNLEEVITLTETPNETSSVSNYVLPINNILESWGDHNTRNGQFTLQQPVIHPLFDTHQKEDIILSFISGTEKIEDNFNEFIKDNFREFVYSKGNYAVDFDTFWHTALHDGAINIPSDPISLAKLDLSKLRLDSNVEKGLTLIIQNNYFIGTGKYSNNGWLQELPHPVTKVTWDNFAAVSPKTAEELNIENDDLIKLSSNGKSVSLPVMIQPGMAENTFVAELGYGRKNSGEVANDVGFNLTELLDSEDNSKFIISDIKVDKTGDKYKLASTQEHHSLDDDFVKDFHRIRKIIQDGTIEEYRKNRHFLHEHKHDIFSITRSHEYKNEKWAMSIDLNKCLGCSECISSCNVENNVPVVGKDQVALGREMQWMRIDRYYSGTPEEPIVSTQPMLCQHCDNAPCENVCPVNATNHSPDGLNQMAYNRCVGTRYCSNNCPYKVRRFNFYNFRDHFEDAYYDNELSYLVNNPEVTVRSRGVIEKCTFCVQNIMEVRETAIREGREILPDEVKTSCQSACPTEAIVFGDSNNEKSTVTKHREHDLSYHVLEELNVLPNVTYLAKIRNTHTEDK